uniref:Uncharacterized protein n=1 Tax=Strix occidentalis caurina TaxID=311401 RepID=A0A8D0ELF5_STROC
MLWGKVVNILSQFFSVLYSIIGFASSFTSRINAVEVVLTCYFPEIPKLSGASRMLGHIKLVSSSLDLTCASSSLHSSEHLQSLKTTKTPMGFRGCLQTPARLWHYPNHGSKFRHLTDHPVSLTGRAALADSLVPKEFHVLKNGGVLPLKYFDEKYTTLLEDREKKLRLFPSIQPSGRLEVIQLMLIRVTGPSQLHSALELMKVEQNIYNVVFHELIWQVSVDCVERGQLLSKLRQRYVSLLERIPEQMKTLCKQMMAQRLVSRHITEELLYFKETVEQLASELYEVREHDHKVTKEAEKNQEELAADMQEAKANANLLEEYQQLYELQRRRLEEQVLLLARERGVCSSAAYDLALKVGIIDRDQLTLVRRLHVSEKTLTNVLKHFIVLLASKVGTCL